MELTSTHSRDPADVLNLKSESYFLISLLQGRTYDVQTMTEPHADWLNGLGRFKVLGLVWVRKSDIALHGDLVDESITVEFWWDRI